MTGYDEPLGIGKAVVRTVEGYEAALRELSANREFEDAELSPGAQQRIAELFGAALTAEEAVDRILADVRRSGDEALRHYTNVLDGSLVDSIEVPREAWGEALESLEPALRDALAIAAEQIDRFHRKQLRTSWIEFDEEGGLGQLVRPLERVGVYAPGGSAVYPSSLLMTAVPARVAGVGEIVVCSPPHRGAVSPLILAAAWIAGVDRVFQVGGAQAIGAMAYGTETVPRVDKILGPGNIFVVLAKRRVYGQVGIDALPGPTETLLIADESADPVLVAADMLAQAEHDPMASAILITNSAMLGEQVSAQLEDQLVELERHEIAAASLAANGLIALVSDLSQAMKLANVYAPEHLCLSVANPWELVPLVRHAGGVFVGEHSPEALGDYTAGPSHVMPTGGTARFSSPVHVGDFVKVINVTAANRNALSRLGAATITLARAEGLTGHARAIERRLD